METFKKTRLIEKPAFHLCYKNYNCWKGTFSRPWIESKGVAAANFVMRWNSWKYNFVEISGNNLEISHSWGWVHLKYSCSLNCQKLLLSSPWQSMLAKTPARASTLTFESLRTLRQGTLNFQQFADPNVISYTVDWLLLFPRGWNFKEIQRNKLRFTWGWAEVLSILLILFNYWTVRPVLEFLNNLWELATE